MATPGYSEDLQSQQANAVTIATPAATTPSSTKTAHFLPEIPPASGTVVSANQSTAASKTGQDALCSQTPASQTQKAVVLNTPAQHYVTPDIQHSAAQKSNGQSSSPQYIIVTVTGEKPVNDWRRTWASVSLQVCIDGVSNRLDPGGPVRIEIPLLWFASLNWVVHTLWRENNQMILVARLRRLNCGSWWIKKKTDLACTRLLLLK